MSLHAAYNAYQAGRLDLAEQHVATHLSTSPADGGGNQLGALIALKRGDLPTAYARIQQSLRDPANLHEKLNTQANILRAAGDDLNAEDAFKASLQAKPDYSVARFNLARLLSETDQPQDAAGHFKRLTQSEPDNPMAWRGLVQSLLESQRLDEARSALDDAALDTSEKTYGHARLLFYRGEFDAALARLKTCLADPAVGGNALILALQTLYMTGEWDAASALIETTLDAYPDRADLWAAAIQSILRSGDEATAEARMKQAPDALPLRVVELDMLLKRSEFAKAKDAALAALRSTPGNQGVMQRLCHAALGTGDHDLAQNVADLGLRAAPNDQSYYAIKATAGRAKGQDYRYFFDYDRFVQPFDLAPPDGWDTIEAFNADLKAALDRLHGFTNAPLDQTLRLGTQTAPDLRFVDDPVIQAFFRAVDPAIKAYLKRIGHNPRHAFLRRNVGGYRIRSAWSVRLGGGGHHVDHIHPEGWISSAYYVDVPKGEGKEGWIKFGEPPAPLNAALGQGPEHEIEPKAGRLVLFPSYLWHGTYPISDGKSRLTLPIDILPARG